MTFKADINAILESEMSDSLKLRLVKILTNAHTEETPLAEWEARLLYDKSFQVANAAYDAFYRLREEFQRASCNGDERNRSHFRYAASRVAHYTDQFKDANDARNVEPF